MSLSYSISRSHYGSPTLKYRSPILALSVLGAALSWILPNIVLAIHAAHGIATVHELESYRLFDNARLEELRVEIGDPDYTVGARIRSVGATHIYLPIVSYIMIGLFCCIGLLAWQSPAPDREVAVTNASG